MFKNKHSFRSRHRPSPTPGNRSSSPGEGRGLWLHGLHSVEAALANPHRRCHRLLLTAEAQRTHGARLAAIGNGPKPEIVDRDAIERLMPGATHQGIALQADPLPEPSIEELCEQAQNQPDFSLVILDQVTDPHNVGAVLRSADAFKAAAVVVPERHAPAATATLAKAASGALERVPLVRVTNLARALTLLKQAGVWCIGLDGDAPTTLQDADLSGRVALVLGAEGEGLRRLTRETCDQLARIPIDRRIGSLNVSNAAAIALYERARRR